MTIRRTTHIGIAGLLLCSLLMACVSIAVAQNAPAAPAGMRPADMDAWQQNLAEWRKQHEMQISARDGWLTLVGLEWLKTGVNTIGSAPDNSIHLPPQAPAHLAMLTVIGGPQSDQEVKQKDPPIVQLLSPASGFPPDFTMDGKPAREGKLQVQDVNGSNLVWRNISLSVLKRGDRFVLRIKDADSPLRTNFHGLNWYAPDLKYRVTARWIPFKPPIVEEIPTVIGTTLKLPAPGLAMFMINGKIMQLEPVIEDPAGEQLFFILRDQSSGSTTYGGGRFLHSGLPDRGLSEPGNLLLDFNQLENPPCAYTDYATCPLPPRQNQLETELPAGEKRYER